MLQYYCFTINSETDFKGGSSILWKRQSLEFTRSTFDRLSLRVSYNKMLFFEMFHSFIAQQLTMQVEDVKNLTEVEQEQCKVNY